MLHALSKTGIFIALIFTVTAFQSCKKIKGCTDADAENYAPDAETSDGSCLFRYLDEIIINSYSSVDGNGNNWDFGSEADLQLYFAKASSENWDYSTPEYVNTLAPANLLIFSEVKLTNESWQFQLEDVDSPSANDFMGNGQFNPLSSGSNGIIDVTSSAVSLSFLYSSRPE
jgi:hypothetical protein